MVFYRPETSVPREGWEGRREGEVIFTFLLKNLPFFNHTFFRVKHDLEFHQVDDQNVYQVDDQVDDQDVHQFDDHNVYQVDDQVDDQDVHQVDDDQDVHHGDDQGEVKDQWKREEERPNGTAVR